MAIKRPIPRAEGISEKINDEVLFSSYSIIMKSGKTLQDEWDEHLRDMEELRRSLGDVKEFVGDNIPIPYQKEKLEFNEGVYQEPKWSGYNSQFMTISGQLTGINADTYWVTFKLTNNDYVWSDGTRNPQPVSWTIDPQRFTIDPVQATPIHEYDGNMKSPIWVSHTSVQLEVTGGTAETSQAGTHDIYLKPRKNYCWADGTTVERRFQWKIARKTISLPVQVGVLYYKGESYGPQSPTWDENGSNTLVEVVDGATEGIQAKTYDIWFKPTSNAMWEDGSYNMRKTTWTISAAALETDITGPDGKMRDIQITFNGSNQQPRFLNYDPALVDAVDVVTDRDGKVTERTELAHRDVGFYTTKFTPNINTSWTNGTRTPIFIYWEITPMSVKVPIIKYKETTSDIKIPYGGVGVEVGPDIIDQDVTWVKVEGMKGDKVKGYTIKFTLKEANNTVWEGGGTQPKTYDWQIVPRLVKVPELLESVVTYNNGKEVSPKIEDYDTNLIKVSDNTANNVGDNYKVKFELIDPENTAWENGETGPQYRSWSVITLAVTPPTITGNSFIYAKGVSQGPTISAYDEQQISVTDYRKTDAGTYVAIISLLKRGSVWSDTGDSEDKRFTWTISPKRISVPVVSNADGKIYNKQMHYVTVSGNDGENNFVINDKDNSTPKVDVYESTYLKISGISGKVVYDYEVVMDLVDKKNTVWTTGGTDFITVKWSVTVRYFHVPVVEGTYEYQDGAEITCRFAGFNEDYMTVTGNKANTVGPHTAIFDLTDKYNTAWNDTPPGTTPGEKPVIWYISAISVDPTTLAIHDADITYDGQSHTVTTANITGFSDTLFRLAGDITKTAANKYTVQVFLKDTAKNCWSDGRAVTDPVDLVWYINKRVMTVPFVTNANTAYEYKGSEITITYDQCTFGNAQDKDFITLKDNTGITAGEYTLYFSILPNHIASCTWADNTTTDKPGIWHINKAYLTTWSISDSAPEITGERGSYVDIQVTRAGNGEVTARSSDTAILSTAIIDGTGTNPAVRLQDAGGTGDSATAIISIKEGDNYFSSADSNLQNPNTCKPSWSCNVTVSTKRSPKDYTPAQIAEIVRQGRAPSMWEVGTTIPIKFNRFTLFGTGTDYIPAGEYNAVILGYDHNMSVECPTATHTMTLAVMKYNKDNEQSTGVTTSFTDDTSMAFFGLNASAKQLILRPGYYPQQVYNALDITWQRVIRRVQNKGETGSDSVFLLSIYEVYGDKSPVDYPASENANQKQYDYFKKYGFPSKVYPWHSATDFHSIHVGSRTKADNITGVMLTSKGSYYDSSIYKTWIEVPWQYCYTQYAGGSQYSDARYYYDTLQIGIIPCFVIG